MTQSLTLLNKKKKDCLIIWKKVKKKKRDCFVSQTNVSYSIILLCTNNFKIQVLILFFEAELEKQKKLIFFIDSEKFHLIFILNANNDSTQMRH
jgi:hypothetical protein